MDLREKLGICSLLSPFPPDAPLHSAISRSALLPHRIIQVGFFWHSSVCERMATEYVDFFIDCFFLAEIVLNFSTGMVHPFDSPMIDI